MNIVFIVASSLNVCIREKAWKYMRGYYDKSSSCHPISSKEDLSAIIRDFKKFTSTQEKGQLPKVFKDSFDAKPIYTKKFLLQKFEYIHLMLLKANGN